MSLLALLSSGEARAQNSNAKPVGPHWSAAEILQAHDDGQGEELRLSVTRSGEGGAPTGNEALALGSDYLKVVSDSGQTIIDTRLKRIIKADPVSGRFENASLYASADFAKRVLEERAALRQRLIGAGTLPQDLPPSVQPFWVESQLGAERAEDVPVDVTLIAHGDGSRSALYDGEVVALWSTTGFALNPGQMHKLRLYLQYHLRLHPKIQRAILETPRLPARIAYRRMTGAGPVEEVYQFSLSGRRSGGFPLDRSLKPLWEAGTEAPSGGEVHQVMLAAVAGNLGGGPKPLAGYVAEARSAVARQAYFDAWLTLREAGQHHPTASPVCAAAKVAAAKGANDCLEPEVLKEIERQDRQVRELTAVLALDEGSSRAKKLIETLVPLHQGETSKNYVLGVMLGDVLSLHPDMTPSAGPDPAELIAEGIRHNPYLAGFYKDLGDHYARNFDFVRAYATYDLGRALPLGSGKAALAEITRYEAELARSFPNFF